MKHCKRFLRRAALLIVLAAVLTVCALAADAEAATPAEFYSALEQNLKAQKGNFSIAYTGDRQELGLPENDALGPVLRNMSARSEDGPDNADYPALNVSEGQMGWLDGAYYFDIEYLATQAELDEVSRRAEEIVGSFRLEDEDEFTKVKLLYEYVCTHYTYDDTLTRFSAYDGLTTGSMVCQGYALLVNQVMWDAGIPCRIVTGTSARENHAWNIVMLDGVWYNLDATWDAADEIGGAMRWDYFLKSQEDFSGHTRFEPYTTDAYEKAHPMAGASMELPRVTVEVQGDRVANLVVRAGVEVQLEAVLPEGMDSEIQWSSGDPGLLQVTADGRVTASGLGQTVITAGVTGRRGVISAQIPTQIVDLRNASGWAYEDVTAYYLAQLLPTSLCSEFQKGLTRGELARLCDQYVQKRHGWGTMLFTNPYTDLDGCPDFLAILRCRSAGLMEGTSETTFSPDGTVTRQQAAVVLARLAAYLYGDDGSGGTLTYPDAGEISAWAAPSVAAVTEAGVMQGTEKGFQPLEAMTREQMITALFRVDQAHAEQDAQAA